MMNSFVAQCMNMVAKYNSNVTPEESPWFDLSQVTEDEFQEAAKDFERLSADEQITQFEATCKYLPFPAINIACKSHSGKPIVFCIRPWKEGNTEYYDLAVFIKEMYLETEVYQHGFSTVILGRDMFGKTVDILPQHLETTHELFFTGVNTIKSLITFCAKAKAVAYKPVANPKNAARAAKGKKPLFDWTTVEIKSVAYKNKPLGGTHASPRQHDRRGHFRHYKSGKRVWVNQMKVGKASNGIIFHDYKVTTLTT